MASDSLSLWLNFILSRRYGITVQGDPLPGEGSGPFLILANNPSLIAPLITYARFAHLKPRPLLDNRGLRVLRPLASWIDPLPGSAPGEGEQRLVEEIIETFNEGRSVLIWPGGGLQTKGVEALNGHTLAHNLLLTMRERELPLPEFVLVRIEGLWGSRFSHYIYPPGRLGLTRTMLRLLPACCFGPLLPRRHINIVLRRHKPGYGELADAETINSQLAGWFNARQHSALVVPLVPGMPARNMPLDPDKARFRVKRDPIPKPAPPASIPPAPPKPDVPDMIDKDIAAKEAATQAEAAQNMQSAPEHLLKSARLAQPPHLPVHFATSRNGDVWDSSVGNVFSRRNILGFSKAIGRDIKKGASCVAIALPAGATAMAAFLACLDQGVTPFFLPAGLPQGSWKGWASRMPVSQAIVNTEDISSLPEEISPVLWEEFGKSALRRGYMSSFAGFAGTEEVGAIAAALPGFSDDASPRMFTHATLLGGLEDLLDALHSVNIKEAALLSCLPPCTVLGLMAGLVLPLSCGVPAACLHKTEEGEIALQAALICNANVFAGTAETLKLLLQAAETPPPLRCAILEHSGKSDGVAELARLKCPELMILEVRNLDGFDNANKKLFIERVL